MSLVHRNEEMLRAQDGQDSSRTNHRAEIRIPANAVLRLRRADGKIIEAGLHDLSAGGAPVETDVPIPAGEHVALPLLGLAAEVGAIAQPARQEFTPLVFVELAPADRVTLIKIVTAKLDGSGA